MVHIWQSTIKKKKYIIPTNNSINSINSNNNEPGKLVKGTGSITIVSETQTQVDIATRGPKVSFGTPVTPTKGVADLGDKTTVGEPQKTPVSHYWRKKARKKHQTFMTPPSIMKINSVSFPVSTSEDIFMPSTKSRLHKYFEYE